MAFSMYLFATSCISNFLDNELTMSHALSLPTLATPAAGSEGLLLKNHLITRTFVLEGLVYYFVIISLRLKKIVQKNVHFD